LRSGCGRRFRRALLRPGRGGCAFFSPGQVQDVSVAASSLCCALHRSPGGRWGAEPILTDASEKPSWNRRRVRIGAHFRRHRTLHTPDVAPYVRRSSQNSCTGRRTPSHPEGAHAPALRPVAHRNPSGFSGTRRSAGCTSRSFAPVGAQAPALRPVAAHTCRCSCPGCPSDTRSTPPRCDSPTMPGSRFQSVFMVRSFEELNDHTAQIRIDTRTPGNFWMSSMGGGNVGNSDRKTPMR